MITEKQFKHYSIIYDANYSDLAETKKAAQAAYKKVRSYFKRLPKFKVELLYSRKRIDKEQGCKTQSWLCGFIKKNTIMIVSPKVWTKITPHPKSDFKQVLCHELVHLTETWKTKHLPAQWLSEGLALYIAGQNLGPIKFRNLQRILNLNYNRIWTNAANEGYPAYPYAAKITEYLIKKYGFRKYMWFLKNTSKTQNKKAMEKTIKKLYNRTAKEIFNEIQTTSR
jgi:hypothetical protein